MALVSSESLINDAIAGKVVSFPTDTLPALGVKPENSQSIFQIKRRSYKKPLILMVGTIADIWQYVTGSPEELKIWQDMANRHLPGALTMVLPASKKIPATMNPLNPHSIGVRVPNNSVARSILQKTGGLATTSANLSGEFALTKMSAIANKFPTVSVLGYQEESNSGVASTVIKWQDNQWQVLRQGQVNIEIEQK